MRAILCAATLAAAVAASSSGFAEEAAAKPEPQARVRAFVQAFFREDREALLKLSSGELKTQLSAHFWIQDTTNGRKAEDAKPRAWEGKIEIGAAEQRKILNTNGVLVFEDADFYPVKVDGKDFEVALIAESVVYFADRKPKDDK